MKIGDKIRIQNINGDENHAKVGEIGIIEFISPDIEFLDVKMDNKINLALYNNEVKVINKAINCPKCNYILYL